MTGKQLKNSILQWAIQGKLVPQDPNDEPASVLLERIREEKARLIKEKKIKKDKNESIIYRGDDNSHYEKLPDGSVRCIDSEIPFEIPDTWCWERWGNIAYSIVYGYNAPAEDHGDIRMVRISDIQDNKVVWEKVPFCKIPVKDIETYLLKPNDILFARTGGTVGKSYIVSDVPYPSIYAGYLIRTQYSDLLCPKYLKFFMESPLYWEELKEGTTATAQPNCNGKKLASMLLPVPPKMEQVRIVARLEEIVHYLERYNIAQSKLDALNTDINNLLKKSILQEAIQGRLVAQDSTDEPSTVLLERIREEKKKLVARGKLKKKDLTDSTIFKGDDNKYYEQIGGKCLDITQEIPFDIPNSWVWTRIKCIYQTSSGGTPEKGHPEYYGGTIPWVKVGDLSNIYISQTEDSISDLGLANSSAKLFPKDTILVAMYCNDAIGKSSILLSSMTTNQAICGLYPNPFLNTEYIYYAIQNNRKNLQEQSAGGAQKNINQKIVNNMLIPIPPIEEQMRIVEKIQRLYKKL